ncbi:hypothetical protein WJX75_003150 [Coccomyxa subellipsoidea]|uniref:Tyrosine-specific transport protein n=1 Tax=Coccomyxa subellipsoidea TaxID=248742 RepID=A0ABR2YPJ8_9CHLO
MSYKDTQRLFSSLDSSLTHQKGSVTGASILVAGTTIGAGILALPYTTQDAGFVPSSAAILGTYAFSIVTGLLLAEANINLMCELGQGGVSITSIAQATLGRTGARLSSAAYLLLHYSLLVAYTAKSGEICSGLLGGSADSSTIFWSVPFCGTLAAGCYFLKPQDLDRGNGILLAAVVLSFMGLVWLTSAQINPANLAHSEWTAVPGTLPVLSLAFVYQNVVPIICSRLEGDIDKLPSGQQNRLPFALTVVPPFGLAALFPDLFFKALDLAGTYGVLSLFGVLPAAAVWSQRSADNQQFSAFRAVPGGNLTLLATGAIAGGIIVNQLFNAVLSIPQVEIR